MKINKSLDIDLNIISPQKHIMIHEGDVDSVDILIGVTVDDESVDLSGVTIKYDATINNYLAEQDAAGSVVDDKISIPVTQNMTAMSGLLLIDVRMIQNDQILFTQTICATVEKAVVNGSTYIDFDKITIIQRMNALEEKMDYIEELVENFDTSKLIVSVNRPPSGAPAEVDVDLLKVGDTWIQQGDEKIVYKLVEAAYHFRPYPTADPYHKFTWQPLNERHIISNTEPPETVTYQAVDYSVDGVAWSWYPVQDYFQSDHYAQRVTVDKYTYYICEDSILNSYNTGVCDYFWREEGGGASSGITIINTETVPESSEWDDSIPTSYAGNTGKAGEIAFWEENGYFWGLYNIATDPITGNINYNWVRQADEIDIDDLKSDIATKMKLAPLNPTAAQIAAMAYGQVYGDTFNNSIVLKAQNKLIKSVSESWVIGFAGGKQNKIENLNHLFRAADQEMISVGTYMNLNGIIYYLESIQTDSSIYPFIYNWKRPAQVFRSAAPPIDEPIIEVNPFYGTIDVAYSHPFFFEGDMVVSDNNELYLCISNENIRIEGSERYWVYRWRKLLSSFTKEEADRLLANKMNLAQFVSDEDDLVNILPGQTFYMQDYIGIKIAPRGATGNIKAYRKEAIDSMIGDIETALSEV